MSAPSFDEVNEIADALVAEGLYLAMRDALLYQGLASLVGSLETNVRPRDQAVLDLLEIQKTGPGSGGEALARFLEAAIQMRRDSPRMAPLRRVLHRLTTKAPAHVESSRRPQRPDLTSVQYARLHCLAREATRDLAELAKTFDLASVASRVRSLRAALREQLYTVTITGKSRAGKSTLLNGLIGRPICPVQHELTTAVPIVIGPAEDESIRIDLKDGTERTYSSPIVPSMLQPYADQSLNPQNERGVVGIDVRLSGSVLDLGVEYVDIPGIDDPSGSVWKCAKERVQQAHALIIVVDVAPYASGGFTIDRQIRELVTDACGRDVPVFIACNKADRLSSDERRGVREYLTSQLYRLGLNSELLKGPYLISAKIGHQHDVEHPELAGEYTRFDDAVWHHLWHNHDIGIRRLETVFANLLLAGEELASIFSLREKSEPQRKRLRTAWGDCSAQQNHIVADAQAMVERIKSGIGNHFSAVREEAQTWIGEQTEAVDASKDKTLMRALKKRVETHASEVSGSLAAGLSANVRPIAIRVDDALARLRRAIGVSSAFRSLAGAMGPVESLGQDPLKGPAGQYREWAGRGLIFGSTSLGAFALGLGAAPALLLGGGVTVGVSLAIKFFEKPPTIEERRAQLTSWLEKCIRSASRQLAKRVDDYQSRVEEQIRGHMEPYLRDVEARLKNLEPPTSEERQLHARMLSTIGAPLQEIQRTLAIPLPDEQALEGRQSLEQ